MGKSTPWIDGFMGGEISELLAARIYDENVYRRSCRQLQNFIATQQGPAMRRPGTVHAGYGKNDGHVLRLIPFDAGGQATYMLEFGDQYIRVYKNAARVGTVEIACPWDEVEAWELQVAQDDTHMYIVHPDYDPRRLEWTSDTVWTLATPTFTGDHTFNSANNRPSCVTFYGSRLIFGHTLNDPQKVFASEVGAYLSFNETTGNAWSFVLATQKSSPIQWLFGGADILVGLPGGNGILTGGDQPIDSTTVMWRVQTDLGSEPIQPAMAASRLVFVQKGGTKIREMYFVFEREGYDTPDLTYWAEHITGTGVTQMAVTNVPETIVWFITNEGELIGMTYEPGYKIAAWHYHVTDGYFESVGALQSAQAEDELWVSVQRTINGSTKRHIEVFKPRKWGTDYRDVFFVDCGITWEGGITYAITGATQADPIVVTCNAHPFNNDEHVWITGILGMTELNNHIYTVKNKAANTFELYNEDGTDGIDGTKFYMDLASAPAPADFSAGATLTGALSGATSEVVQKVTSVRYLCRNRSGPYTDGENISDGVNTATGAAGYPIIDDVYDAYTSEGTAQQKEKVITGLGHLEGKLCAVCVDGANHPDREVHSSSIELQLYGNVVHVGLPYASYLKPSRIEAGGESGPAQGKKKRFNTAVVRFYKTIGCEIGTEVGNLVEMGFRDTYDELGQPPDIFSGDRVKAVPGGWQTDGYILLAQRKPLPCTICGLGPEMETNEGA